MDPFHDDEFQTSLILSKYLEAYCLSLLMLCLITSIYCTKTNKTFGSIF